MVQSEERQKRIDQIERENKALRELNDLSDLKNRIKNEPSLVEQTGLTDDSEIEQPIKKIANPPETSI